MPYISIDFKKNEALFNVVPTCPFCITFSKNVISFNGIMCTIKMFRKWIQVLVKFDATI